MTTNLAPELREWTFAGRQFKQEPFGLDRTSQLLNLVAGVFQKIANAGDFDKLSKIDTAKPESSVDLFGIISGQGPEIITDFLCLCLDVTDETDRAYVYKHCKPVQMMRIFTTFMQQNDVKEIIDSFLELRSTLENTVSKPSSPSKNEASTISPSS